MRPLPLHDRHAELGARFGAINATGEDRAPEAVLGYSGASGSVEAEYSAVQATAGLADLSYREWIRVTGEDRVSFLQGMVTNDVAGLAVGQTTYAALLTNKGAMVGDARIWRREAEVLLDVEPGFGDKVRDALNKYLISEDAELHDATAEHVVLALVGPKALELARAALPELPALQPGHFAELRFAAGPDPAPVWVTPSRTWGLPALELVVGPQHAAALHTLLAQHATPIGFETLEILRVEAGTPRYGLDMDEKTIPLEANLDHAIHYKKGCYIGQEVIARATFRGHMNRKLTGLSLDAAPAVPRAELRAGDRKVGWLTSVVRSPAKGLIALGYVHRDLLDPGTKLDVADSTAHGTVTPLPFR